MKDTATEPKKSKLMKAGNGGIPDVSSWMDSGIHAWESWAQSNSSLMKGSLELAQEMLTFSQARLQADIDAWTALTACRNPGDLFERQKDFAEKAAAQYLEEANKLTSRMISIMSDAAVPFREQATKT
jgi:hypothetical protein